MENKTFSRAWAARRPSCSPTRVCNVTTKCCNWAGVNPTFKQTDRCETSCGSNPSTAAKAPIGQLAARKIEVVPGENIAEKVGLQIMVDDRCEVEHPALDRMADQAGLDAAAGVGRRKIGWQRCGIASRLVADTAVNCSSSPRCNAGFKRSISLLEANAAITAIFC